MCFTMMGEGVGIMSKIPAEATPLERITHQAFHDIANKFGVDVDLVAEIIEEYTDTMSRKVQANSYFTEN